MSEDYETNCETTAAEFAAALKYDERIWRVFQMLKSCHREGFVEALRATNAKLRTALAAAEAERDKWYRAGHDGIDALADKLGKAESDLDQCRRERDEAREAAGIMKWADDTRLSAKLVMQHREASANWERLQMQTVRDRDSWQA